MSNIRTFFVPEGVTASGTGAGGDCFGGNGIGNFLLGSMMGCGGMGGFGGMGGAMWFWPWLFLACGRNGGWFGNDGNGGQLSAIQETLQTMQGNQAVQAAIQGGVNEIRELSNQTGLGFSSVQGAISAVKDVITGVGSQNGMNFMQVMNAVGNNRSDIISQMQSCCCDMKQLVTNMSYENRLADKDNTAAVIGAVNQNSIGQERGFTQLGYTLAQQFCDLKSNNDANTRSVLGKLDQIEDARKDREIAALQAQLVEARSDAKRKEELAPLFAKLEKIECNQPQMMNVPAHNGYYVPDCVMAQLRFNELARLYGLTPATAATAAAA